MVLLVFGEEYQRIVSKQTKRRLLSVQNELAVLHPHEAIIIPFGPCRGGSTSCGCETPSTEDDCKGGHEVQQSNHCTEHLPERGARWAQGQAKLNRDMVL